MTRMIIEGDVTTSVFAPGSKSEHNAVWITLDDGTKYKLVRGGGNPFNDSQVQALVGKRVAVDGNLTGATFKYTSVNIKEK